jgi:hypothetical protein
MMTVSLRMNSWILAMPEWHRCEVELLRIAACHGNSFSEFQLALIRHH